ncbi:hypothetical protein D9758_017029 [Tetrapyrgos nigripes]|uniref:3'-5' exonuclease domain-containing protein n=1 Tax=Tetrapyrgos nigripes TaxID=182062 RepID=A0A8H5CJQ8_9AGAR|nr:hypothetical protein D9758_017029 [Tetrapyrgos nigripes]
MSGKKRGRPPGVLNQSGHSAGGARPNAGRKPSQSATSSSSSNKSGGIPIRIFPIFNTVRRSQDTPSTQDNANANSEVDQSTVNSEQPFPFLPEHTSFENLDSIPMDGQEASEKPIEDNIPADDTEGIINTYLHSVRDKLAKSLNQNIMPFCYMENSFWVESPDPIFAMRHAAKSDQGLNPAPYYRPKVFVWLPQTIDRSPLTCQNSDCSHYHDPVYRLKDKGWLDTPIARKVIGLDSNYYIMTKRFYCPKDASGGCGQSWVLYHPDILKQLEPALADRFPAFLTHRSAIDKTLLALIRTGIAHRVSSSAWEEILRELHVREHDIWELHYLQTIQHEQMLDTKNSRPLKQYPPFSAFSDKGNMLDIHLPKITSIMCIWILWRALDLVLINWDHSFKVPKYMMRLNGVVVFVGLFTVLNEFGQIRYQAFVPTKSLTHIRAGMKAITKSLQEHGHPQPILGFTDNVGADLQTFMECIPSLGKNVTLVDPAGSFPHLPRMQLPSGVSPNLCKTPLEIETACHGILALIDPDTNPTGIVSLGFDMEWEYSTGIGGTGSKKTAIIQLATPTSVYLLCVYLLDKLPGSLKTILMSDHLIKIGRNIAADFSKLARDFKEFELPRKIGNQYQGTVELGSLAKQKQVTSDANTSLSNLVAAVLRKNLSKEMRSSEWGSAILTQEQIQYAALDAWVALELYNCMQALPDTGIPLSATTHVGQLVSLFVKQQEVARGKIVEQPANLNIKQNLQGETKEVNININTTKTRALIEIFEVLAPACIVAHHRMSLSDIQNGQEKFLAVVSLSSLRTYTPGATMLLEQIIPELPKNMGAPSLIRPPQVPDAIQSTVEQSDLIQSGMSMTEIRDEEDQGADQLDDDSDDSEDETEDITKDNTAASQELPAFTQGVTDQHDSHILADIFHVIQKVTKTISKRHSLSKRFARAFSDTLLIPDETDKNTIEAYLAKRNLDWNTMRAKRPSWLWRRVRRYVPRKEVLHPILKEFFDCWGNVICSVRKIPLFNEESWKKAHAVLQDVQRGWLSDPSSIPLYVYDGQQEGLTLYRCLRGTNSVEGGVHNPIHRLFAALNASPELADSLTTDFRHRHNTKQESRHKYHTEYKGHYDPWLSHAIHIIRGDIQWIKAPPSSIWSLTTTDPLSFAASSEQFGITRIPPEVRSDMHFATSLINNTHEEDIMSSYSIELLSLSKLSGKTKNVYNYLASVQGTQHAVVPLHTKEEYELFHILLRVEVNAKGAENSVFYKLPEHLEHYYNTWDEYRKTRQTMIQSQVQRQPNHDHIHTAAYVSETLPSAHHSRPGVLLQHEHEPEVSIHSNVNPDNNFDFAYSRSASPPSVELSTMDIDAPIIAPLSTLNDRKQQFMKMFGDVNEQSIFSGGPNDQPQPSQMNPVHGYLQPLPYYGSQPVAGTSQMAEHQTLQIVEWRNDRAKRRRKCKNCENYDCPGENNRARCNNK